MLDRITKSKRVAAVSVFAAVSVLLAMNLAIATPTYAQTPTPQTSRVDQRQEARAKQFKREQTWFDTQTKALTNAGTIATKTQNYIDAQNALGKDTSSLAAALATFNAQIATAQSAHTIAGNLISAHAGFDANGTVTNLTQATLTVVDVRQSLMDAHQLLRQATLDLRNALRAYRQANKSS
jgi:hypothetical protein